MHCSLNTHPARCDAAIPAPKDGVDARLSFALEGRRQISFDWHIPSDELCFSADLMDEAKAALRNASNICKSSTFATLVHSEDQNHFKKCLRDALKGASGEAGSFYRVELRLKDAVRGWRWVDISGKIVQRDSSGKAIHMIGIFHDIDERKQTEMKVERLRDLYATSSQINQILMRVSDRDFLFGEICRLAVEQGRFRTAWIGMVFSHNQAVLPIAGYEARTGAWTECASQIDHSTPHGQGVISPAIREGLPIVCNDIHSTGLPRHWLAAIPESEAASGSVACLPFRLPGEAIGVLHLHNDEKNFFESSAIDLLGEIALDLSFALHNHARAGQQRASTETAPLDSERFTRTTSKSTAACTVIMDRGGVIVSFDRAAENILGHRYEDVRGKNFVDVLIPPDWHDQYLHAMTDFLSGDDRSGREISIELVAMRADGSKFSAQFSVALPNVGDSKMIIVRIRDLSAQSQRQPVLPDSALRYRHLVDMSPEAMLVYLGTTLALANQAAARLLGAGNDTRSLLGRSILDFVHQNHHALLHERACMSPEDAAASPFLEQVWMRLDSTELHVEVAATNLLFDGKPSVQLVVRDITERKRTEALQRGQNRILNMIATGSSLTEILTEIAQFADSQANHGPCVIQQVNREGKMVGDPVAPNVPAACVAQLAAIAVGPDNSSFDMAAPRSELCVVKDLAAAPAWRNLRDNTLMQDLKAYASWPLFGKHQNVLGTFTFYFREATAPSEADCQLADICANLAGIAIESRMSEEKIRYLAHYDGLTSLPNRFLFKEYLGLALRNAQRRARKFAVFFLDLDKFKEVNDTLGHAAGDQVLREIATRLRSCLRHTDKIARMGGDEFYILIEDLSDGRYAADVAKKLLDAACSPVQVQGQNCSLSASIGIAIYPDHGNDGQTLLKNADRAMYRAKEMGKNTYRFYSADVRGDASCMQGKSSLPPRAQGIEMTSAN
jgi:diguanylate cyclase (GGDEF)-like protein/PAS domain S-box-containing protein